MKVVFVGPTLFGLIQDEGIENFPGLLCRPPAAQGDIAKAVLDGASVIGLVDGRYEDIAAPWHKEILWAIQNGLTVLGGGSLGALRACECAPFGMIGVGKIFERYANEELVDDSDVAQLHGPAELGFLPLTEALVNVLATIDQARDCGDIDKRTADNLFDLARATFFKELTFETLSGRHAGGSSDAASLCETLLRNRVDLKREDALRLLEAMQALPDSRSVPKLTWKMAEPLIWTKFMQTLTA